MEPENQVSSTQPIKDDEPLKGDDVQKKSILKESSLATIKRASSRATIQWKDEYPLNAKILVPPIRMVNHGAQWRDIPNIMLNFQFEERSMKHSSEGEIWSSRDKMSEYLFQEFGLQLKQKRADKGVELSLDQQVHLEVLKQKIKVENDLYLKRHPELDLLLLLVYRELFENQPDDPKLFIAEYVHRLNTNREMMVWEEVDVPFDKPPEPEVEVERETITTVDKERQKIIAFARKLVDRCARIAYQGEAYVDVTSMLEFMLYNVDPSEVSIRSSAESAVADILSLLLASVELEDDTCTTCFVDEILNSILRTIHHSIKTDSEVYLEMRESINRFIKTLLKTAVGKASKDI